MSSRFRRRATALLATLIGVTVAGAAVAPAASAAPLVDIDPYATATLHIHKLVQPDEFGDAADGLPKDTSGMTPLPGVDFTVQKVSGVDLTTNAGWQDAAALTPEQAAARAEKPGATKTTDAGGDADFADLPLGLYLVTETSAPAGVTPAKPFLITLPLTDPVNKGTWLYDVHVYPKNAVTGAEKTVKDSPSVVAGDEIEYTIDADIPRVEVIDGYKIVDKLDTRLDHDSTAVSLTDGTTITEGKDFTIAFDKGTNAVTVEFTEQGRAVLAAHATSAQVRVIIKAKANATGAIPNEAIVYPNAPSFDVKPGEPGGPIVTPPVETRWGVIVIEKVDADNTDTMLAGAVFRVYMNEADARAQKNPLTVDGKADFETGADGRAVISGLRYSDFADGKQLEPGDPNWRSYWLVETKAPEGFELLAEPLKVDVTSDDPAQVSITVKNVPHNAGFFLPQTGLAGTAGMLIGGAILLAGVLTITAARRRKARIA